MGRRYTILNKVARSKIMQNKANLSNPPKTNIPKPKHK